VEHMETVLQLFMDFKKAYGLVRREVSYDILIEFGTSMKLVTLVKICLNEDYSKDRMDEHLSVTFPIQNGLKLGDTLALLLNFTSELQLMEQIRSWSMLMTSINWEKR
jgi:hypothetical protein